MCPSRQIGWDCIKERKQHRILQNNKKENARQIPHTYNVGDQVIVNKEDQHCKLSGARFSGPYTVTQVNDNGTIHLSRATNGGAVLTMWNIPNVKPC
jgi:hypothetical protein